MEDEDRSDFSLAVREFLAAESAKHARLPVPREIKRSHAVRAFQEAFELIGGIPRLAIWADENPSQFYKLYSRLIPPAVQEVNGKVTLVHVLPRTLLDGEVEVLPAEHADAQPPT